jgi:UDP:flavonoid glycosyltransferase YjiC (YdhE family)
MTIVLATYGSRGDVQPMLALSLALQAGGHEVLLAAPPEKAGWAAQLGCPFYPLGSDVTAFIDRMADAHSLRSAFRFVAFVAREIRRQFRQLPAVIADADLVVGSSLVFALSSLAEAMGIRYRYIAFTPQLLPCAGHPFPAFRHQRRSPGFNRLTWRLAGLCDRIYLDRLVGSHRKKLRLAPIRNAWRHMLGPDPIVASDRAIATLPGESDVPHPVQTGYMHLDQPAPVQPDLERFLAQGPPPIYAGFGSMPPNDQIGTLDRIITAARRTGRRLVIGRFWGTAGRSADDHGIFFVRKFPHLHLFPRMAAVIHHGGAGTTAVGARCGTPQIVVPHILDQYYWGERVRRAGLGPEPIWRSRLTADGLTAAIEVCLNDNRIRRQTRIVADDIGRTDGVLFTVAEIERSVLDAP